MALADAIEGSRHTAQQITWKDKDGVAVDLTGATLTGRLKDTTTGAITSIDSGALTLVTAASGIFQWAYGVNDVGTVGVYEVQFIATFGAGDIERSIPETWRVIDAFDV